MLNYDQRELLEEIEYSGMDIESTMEDLISSSNITTLRGNLILLISEAKTLVEMAIRLDQLVGVAEKKGEVGP